MNYSETIEYLFSRLPMFQRDGKIAFKKNLDNTLALCKHLDEPQKKFKTVHIAGTNGKGSTAHMLASVFQEAGYKTGLYTSPHLKDFRERIRINGEMVDKISVVDFVAKNKNIFDQIQPSFFEWTVALAFTVFAEQKVDIAIIETGMGGRLDSTNVIFPELSIITNIGLDHTQYLGNDLKSIALEKAGIIKQNVPVVIGEKGTIAEVFIETAKQHDAELLFAEDLTIPSDLQSGLKGNYQNKNIRCVYAAWKILKKLGWRLDKKDLYEGCLNVIKNTGLRGRWEILAKNPLIVADTAHNEDGLKMVLNQIANTEFKNLHFVFGLVSDKDLASILKLLPKEANYYFCAASIPRALPATDLKNAAKKYLLKGESYPSVQTALKAAKDSANKGDMIYIGGSTFVVAEAI